jgi:hypothetical protein
MKLATLCSQAVDYAKNGNPVEIHNLPKPLIKFKPDWHKSEVTGARELDYYVSERALGYMFRNIELLDPEEPVEGLPNKTPKQKFHSKIRSRTFSRRSFSAHSTRTWTRTVLS